MADLDLDRLEADLAKATPGEWETCERSLGTLYHAGGRRTLAEFRSHDLVFAEDCSNAQLCAELKNSAPELLRRARELERFREMLFQMSHDESHGCVTGDCPHDSVQECVKDLSELLKERASESRSALDQSKE